MIIGNRTFTFGKHTHVMGILNVTPDSFSDGGKYDRLDAALFRAEEMIREGADIIDVGGESTRPGYERVPEEEEIGRVAPVIAAVKERFDIPVSLDTCKARVAREGIDAGADLINDIWALQADEAMGKVIASSRVACCLMHNRRDPPPGLTMDRLTREMGEDVKRALDAGIATDRIILDPGVGFAKTQEENLMVIANLRQCRELGLPLLLGTSRKSCIGYILDLPTDQRLEGTLATTAWAVLQNIAFVRVHDVKENVRFIRMMEALRDRNAAWQRQARADDGRETGTV